MIDWDEAPEWANYVAMDADGEWWWYEEEPQCNLNIINGVWHAGDRAGKVKVSRYLGVVYTLQQRPLPHPNTNQPQNAAD